MVEYRCGQDQDAESPKPLGEREIVHTARRSHVEEQRAVWLLVQEIRTRITASLKVEAFSVGFADGDHAHVHVVPRGPGESVVLPSGIEWVNPDQ